MRRGAVYHDVLEVASASEVVPGLLRVALPTPTLPPATTTNHYVAGEQRAVLVDPSTPDKAAQRLLLTLLDDLRPCGVQVEALFLTHHHRDHVGAASALREATGLPVWAHEKTALLLEGLVRVDRLIADGDEVAVDAAGVWHALHTPGHAPGHLCLVHSAHRGLVAGDMVAGEGTILVDPHDGHMGSYLASLAAMARLEPKFLAPAHGPVLDDAQAVLAHFQRHRLAREAKVAAALAGDWQEAADLLPVAYADVGPASWPVALRSIQAHLLHLEELGAAERSGQRWRRAS